VLLFAFVFSSDQTKHVKAQELNVTNAVSFFDIGRGNITSVVHDHGHLYVSIRDQGIFLYTESGLTKLTESESDSLSFDSEGSTLLFSQGGHIVQLNVKIGKEKIIFNGSASVQYEQPVWKNKNEMYATKKRDNQEQIVHISLETKKERVIADGSHPVLIEQNEQLVYEHNGNVMVKMESSETQLVDKGTDPSVSEDGRYISYVKKENGISNVWIIDADLKTKKKITTNIPMEASNKQKGVYQYSSPVWDSGKRQLYVMKKNNRNEEIQQVQLMKIELSHEKLTAEETIERYLQALVVRDDDYAKSLMENPPEFLTYSNPHQTGYHVLQAEERGDSVYVQAELYREDTARPYYSVTTYKFELRKGGNGYIIHRTDEVDVKELSADDMNDLKMISGEKQESLFTLQDVPKQQIKTDNIRLASLVWNQKKDQIIFSIQEMNEVPGVTLWIYDRKNKQFTFLDRIDSINKKKNIVMIGMALSQDGRYLALDLDAGDNHNPRTSVLMYDLEKGKRSAQLDQAHSVFWQGDHFLFERLTDQQAMLYSFHPETNETSY
jgi:hypothetical protein